MRGLPSLVVYVPLVAAFIGLVMFVGGIAGEVFSDRDRALAEGLSPLVVLALGGLCLAAFMFALWFVLAGLLLARQSREQGPNYAEAYRLIEAFKFRDAIPLLERSIREGKETSENLMLLTSAYAYSGQLAKSQATADRAVSLFPNDPGAYITMANNYRMQAVYDESARSLQQAVDLAPDQPVTLAELGFVQRFAGDNEAALESLKAASNHAMPAMYGVRVYYHLAQAYQAAGETRQAVKAAAKMMSARSGLSVWQSVARTLEGTAYGQSLRYEIAAIEQAIHDADAGNLG